MAAESTTDEAVTQHGTMVFFVESDFRQCKQATSECGFNRLIQLLISDLLMALNSLPHQVFWIVLFDCLVLAVGINQDNSCVGDEWRAEFVNNGRSLLRNSCVDPSQTVDVGGLQRFRDACQIQNAV